MLVLAAAISDVRRRRIPNKLVLAGIIAGFLWNLCQSGGAGARNGFLYSSAGLGLGFLLYLPFYLLRGMRAGDVKLLAAVGSVTGATNILWIFFLTALFGGAFALVYLAFRGQLNRVLFNVGWLLRDLFSFRAPYSSSPELDVQSSSGIRIPHAPLVLAGVLAFALVVRLGSVVL